MSTVYVDVVRPGRGLVAFSDSERGGEIILTDGDPRYAVEDDTGTVVAFARSYRGGANKLAMLYGINVSRVEVDHEWRSAR